MSRPMVSRPALQEEVAETFSHFASGGSEITPSTLEKAMVALGRPVEPLVVQEMIQEATSSSSAGAASAESSVRREEFCAMIGIQGT